MRVLYNITLGQSAPEWLAYRSMITRESFSKLDCIVYFSSTWHSLVQVRKWGVEWGGEDQREGKEGNFDWLMALLRFFSVSTAFQTTTTGTTQENRIKKERKKKKKKKLLQVLLHTGGKRNRRKITSINRIGSEIKWKGKNSTSDPGTRMEGRNKTRKKKRKKEKREKQRGRRHVIQWS